MAKARIQYTADWEYVDKQLKEYSLTQEVIEKLDSIEPGAERNFIQWIKVNWDLQEPDEYRVVDISVPIVEDVLNSTDRTAALSARQGRVLYNYIQNLQALGKFLSNWNSTTGMPTTNPSELPYVYKSWDYYIISIIWATNYRPEWASFNWWASSTVETEEAQIWDIYMYDWTNWLFLLNNERQIAVDSSLSTTSTNPVENRVITNAINGKQDVIIAGSNIQIATDWKTISATDTTYSAWANVNITNNVISATDTTYTAWTNVNIDSNNVISATDTVYWAWANIQISAQNIISATDTTYTAGTWINIDANNVISNTWKTFLAFPNTFDTTHTTSDFLDSIVALHLPVGSAYLWQVSLSDMPTWVTVQWDVEVYVYPQNVIYAIMRSVEVEPYQWVVDSYSNSYYNKGWMPVGNFVTEATTPSSADEGMLWYDTTNNLLKVYDGSAWHTIDTDTTYSAWTWIDITNSTISIDNTVVATQTDLSSKQDTLIAWTNIQIANDWKTISATDTTYVAWDFDIKDLADSTWLRTNWSWKQDTIIAGTNIQVAADGKTISAIDTTYTAWTWISIDANNVISNTQTSAEWWNITWTLADQTDLNTALWNKANTSDVLAKYNTTSFTPSWDYNPATKKYVDDSVSAATSWAVSDIVYWNTWDWVTWIAPSKNAVYDKISAMDTTISNKANSSDVPTKTSDLTNDWSDWINAFITANDLPIVNDWTLTIQKNWTNVATFTANQSWNSTANLVIPTTYSDVNALPDSTKYWASIDLSMNNTTYVITAQLKDQDWNNLGVAKTIDLPLESVVVSGSYDSANKKVVLTLENWSTIEFSVADLVSWLQTEITSSNKLDADLVDDSTSTNKFVTSSDITNWNGKQNALSIQTAYTSQGSATKVPQITTNSLWQVTWITEVTITQPDISWKLDKVTSTATNPRAYIVNADWTQSTLSITDSATSGTIVKRSWTQIIVPETPTANWHAASKKYVDDWLSWKQAALSTQTAYTSQWSATKVPQITTNTLGQVTWITEVTITQPTVNNATISLTQAWWSIWSFTTNQASASTIDFEWNLFVTQAEYTTLDPWNDWNTYFIYET